MAVRISHGDIVRTFDPLVLTGIVTPIDALLVKYLKKRSLRAGAWVRGAVVAIA
jgi:hypothetical protein